MSDGSQTLRRKIDSAGDLQSVVRSMKALAAASIGQYEKSVQALAEYDRTVELGLSVCFRADGPVSVTAGDAASHRHHGVSAVVFGSDQGLVGPFNDIIADHALATLAPLPDKPQVWAVGDRVHARLVSGGITPIGLFALPNQVQAIAPLVGQIQIASEAQRRACGNTTLWLFHNAPRAGAQYTPVGQRLLPLDAQWQHQTTTLPWPTANLPEVIGAGDTTLRALIREYLFISLFRACAESLASENASRLSAMQRAEKNIADLLNTLNHQFNQLRQTSIDEELFDVIAGFEALSGAGGERWSG